VKVNHWYNRRFSQWMDWFKKPYKKNSADFLNFDSLAGGAFIVKQLNLWETEEQFPTHSIGPGKCDSSPQVLKIQVCIYRLI